MTEAEWLTAIPSVMMHHVKLVAPKSFRKLRLLAISYAQFLETLQEYQDAKRVSHLAEEVVEGRKSLEVLMNYEVWGYDGDWRIANLVLVKDEQLDQAVRKGIYFSAFDSSEQSERFRPERFELARSLIQCILGNPFRPVAFDPAWLTSTSRGIAHSIYDDRAFDRLPILADALQDAGCENDDILSHCRGAGPHVRGCWVVDLVLGKE